MLYTLSIRKLVKREREPAMPSWLKTQDCETATGPAQGKECGLGTAPLYCFKNGVLQVRGTKAWGARFWQMEEYVRSCGQMRHSFIQA